MEDVDRTILFNEEAIKATTINTPARADYINTLGTALQCRYDRTGSMEDLHRAIAVYEDTLKSAAQNQSSLRASYLNNLGVMLRVRSVHRKSLKEMNQAIAFMEDAIKLTPSDDPERPKF